MAGRASISHTGVGIGSARRVSSITGDAHRLERDDDAGGIATLYLLTGPWASGKSRDASRGPVVLVAPVWQQPVYQQPRPVAGGWEAPRY